MFKAGVYLNLSEILGSLTEGLKVKENVLEHHQTVDCPRKGNPGWWTTVWCVYTNFKLQILILKQHQIFQISYFH